MMTTTRYYSGGAASLMVAAELLAAAGDHALATQVLATAYAYPQDTPTGPDRLPTPSLRVEYANALGRHYAQQGR